MRGQIFRNPEEGSGGNYAHPAGCTCNQHPATNEAAERLWLRVNQPDVPIEIAPMLRDVLRWNALDREVEWRAAERRATVERIRSRIGHTALARPDQPWRMLRDILDEEAAR